MVCLSWTMMRMTEELPQVDVDKYKFPDKYFEKLREYEDVHEGMYAVVTGGLYRACESDCNFTDKDAMEVVRELQQGEIDEAEDMVYERLDSDGQGY